MTGDIVCYVPSRVLRGLVRPLFLKHFLFLFIKLKFDTTTDE